jgi:hypothetical protein
MNHRQITILPALHRCMETTAAWAFSGAERHDFSAYQFHCAMHVLHCATASSNPARACGEARRGSISGMFFLLLRRTLQD